MTSNAHNRQVSTHSAYSLASPISLPTALPTSLHRQNSRHSFFAKLGKGRSRSNSRGQKSTSSEEWEWTCRGEDLEDNFTWPPEGWSDSEIPKTPPLVHSRQSSGSHSRHSSISFDSATPSSISKVSTRTPSLHESSKPLDTLAESLPAVINDPSDDTFIQWMKCEINQSHAKPEIRVPPPSALGPQSPLSPPNHTRSTAAQIDFQPAEIRPLRLSRSAEHNRPTFARSASYSSQTTAFDDELAQRRRQAEETLAIEAISTLFKRSTLQTLEDADSPTGPSRTKLESLSSGTSSLPRGTSKNFSSSQDQDSVPRLGSPFHYNSTKNKSRPSHHRRTHASATNSPPPPDGQPLMFRRRPSAEKTMSLVSVAGAPSEFQTQADLNLLLGNSVVQGPPRPRSIRPYDFI